MWVGRRKIMAVIDTTAQVTLINRRLSQELGCQDLVERVQLQNAQMDSWMDGGIVQHFGFQWGRQKYFWDVVEADIGDDFIIGVDFLKSVKCKIDLEGNVLKLGNGDRVQAMMKKNGDGQEIHVGVVAAENFSSAKEHEICQGISGEPNWYAISTGTGRISICVCGSGADWRQRSHEGLCHQPRGRYSVVAEKTGSGHSNTSGCDAGTSRVQGGHGGDGRLWGENCSGEFVQRG